MKKDKLNDLNNALDHILDENVAADSRTIPETLSKIDEDVAASLEHAAASTLFFKASDVFEKCIKSVKGFEDGAWNNAMYAYLVGERMIAGVAFQEYSRGLFSSGIVKNVRASLEKMNEKRDEQTTRLFGINAGLELDINEALAAAMKTSVKYENEIPVKPVETNTDWKAKISKEGAKILKVLGK